jgi:hypothetical protein
VREFEQSGLTRQAFSAPQGVRIRTLDHYRKHFRPLEEGQVSLPAAASRILHVEFVGSMHPIATAAGAEKTGLRVTLANGRSIEVKRALDASTLERLVAVLEKG